jgi:ABC-2 type transport system permease protein
MALVLARLRLLIAARHRSNSSAAGAYYAITWVVGGLFGLIAGTGTAVFVSDPTFGNVLLLGSFVALSLPWLIGPILEPTLADGIVDPRRLEQFPLTSGQQVLGLLLGALVAPTATFTLLFAAGSVAAFGESLPSRLAALVAAVAYTVMCVAVSRSAQALLAESLRSRRGRDLAALLAALMVLGLYGAAMHLRTTISSINTQLAGPVGQVAAWLPPGAAAQAIIESRDGNWIGYFARLAVVIATIIVALLAWAWALGRRARGDSSSLGRGYRRSVTEVLPLIPAGIRFLPANPTTSAIAQQWRYFFFRSPKAIQTLIIPPVMGIMVAHSTFAGVGIPAQTAAFSALAVVVGSFNVFGYDGSGFRFLIASGAPLSKVMLGKVIAPLLYLVPILIAFAGVEGLLQNRSGEIPAAIMAGLAVILTGVGIGSQSSVLNPNDQSRIGHRQGMFLKVFGWFSGFFAVVSVGAAVWIIIAGWAGTDLTSAIMVAAAAALAAILVTKAGRRLDDDPDDMLRRLIPAEF